MVALLLEALAEEMSVVGIMSHITPGQGDCEAYFVKHLHCQLGDIFLRES